MATKSAGPLESTIQAAIVKACRARGVHVWKVHGGPYQQPGIPDLCLTLRGIAGYIECKRPGQKPTAIQVAVMNDLRKHGAIVGVATCVSEAMVIIDAMESRAKCLP